MDSCIKVVSFANQNMINFDVTLALHSKQGTTRPTHYHVLLDEIGFTADDLQELVHSLSYV